MTERRTPAWQVTLAFVALALLYCAISLQRHRNLDTSSFDLGVFTQIVRQWSELEVPTVWLTDGSRLAAHHFSPALVAFVPGYWLFPSPVSLLVQQALVVAVGVVPLMRHAGRLGRTWPWVVACTYGVAPGVVTLVGFDVHEVALAVPLLAFSVTALLERRHRAAVLWALPIVLVKEDLGLTLAAVGAVVLLQGSRRLGAATVVGGAVVTAVTMLWVLPALDGGGYFYGASFAPSGPGEAWRSLVTGVPDKARTVLTLLVPVALLPMASPIALVALPTLGWRFVAEREEFWVTGFQYDAVLVPVVVAAMLDTVRRLPRRMVLPLAVTMLVLTAALVPFYDAGNVARPGEWRTPARTSGVLRALEVIPDGARVAASNHLGPRLVSRTQLYFFGDVRGQLGGVTQLPDLSRIDWIAYDDERDDGSDQPDDARRGTPPRVLLDRLVDAGEFRVVERSSGVVIARRVGGE